MTNEQKYHFTGNIPHLQFEMNSLNYPGVVAMETTINKAI